ncbi:MAG: ribosome small subunit-dependent GTPase A [Acidobacteria bacterium]|nr:ribosome small subunit-dependent GTPase A [Acidobacteriota bacterium]
MPVELEALGWSAFFDSQITPAERKSLTPARVAVEFKATYRLLAECGELQADLAGRLRRLAQGRHELPAVGDWVLADCRENERQATIHRVLERRSKVSRKAAGARTEEQIVASNIDTIFIVGALTREFNLRRIERYLMMVWGSGAMPVVLLNKADLNPHPEALYDGLRSVAPGVPVHVMSALTGTGLSELATYLKPAITAAFVGSSGVGKSTVLNQLMAREVQRVHSVRADDDRGRHTTSSRQLFLLPEGGIVIDTPGMRELQVWDPGSGFGRTFEDIEELARHCRFRDCLHHSEPGCAVERAVGDGTLEPNRAENYRKLQKEAKYLERKQDALAQITEKKKWKKIHKALRK